MITREDVDAAERRITGRVRVTPVFAADAGTFGAAEVLIKCEYVQHTGSFKARGATNRILSAIETGILSDAGVIAASGGNAGLAVAYAAGQAGVRAEIFLPNTAPAIKVAKLHKLGAKVVQVGSQYAEAYDAAISRQRGTGAMFCHAYDEAAMCAGAGTVGLELDRQTGGVDTVLIAVGGGGLMSGVATALAGRSRVVAVEPNNAPTLCSALEAGGPVDVDVAGVAADSLGARRVGEIAFDVAVRTGVRSVLVDDESIVAARQWIWDEWRIVVEHGTAASLAALQTGAYQPVPGERVAVLLCGGNTDPSSLT